MCSHVLKVVRRKTLFDKVQSSRSNNKKAMVDIVIIEVIVRSTLDTHGRQSRPQYFRSRQSIFMKRHDTESTVR